MTPETRDETETNFTREIDRLAAENTRQMALKAQSDLMRTREELQKRLTGIERRQDTHGFLLSFAVGGVVVLASLRKWGEEATVEWMYAAAAVALVYLGCKSLWQQLKRRRTSDDQR
jgi:Flp pilus assembly protein TadB